MSHWSRLDNVYYIIVQKYNLVYIVQSSCGRAIRALSLCTELSWHFQHLAQGSNCLLLLNTAVPTESMTMAFVEQDECISIISLYISVFLISFLDYMFRIWISSPELSYVYHTCHAYMCSYVGQKFVIKILVPCYVETNITNSYTCPAIYNNLDAFICRLVAVYSFS